MIKERSLPLSLSFSVKTLPGNLKFWTGWYFAVLLLARFCSCLAAIQSSNVQGPLFIFSWFARGICLQFFNCTLRYHWTWLGRKFPIHFNDFPLNKLLFSPGISQPCLTPGYIFQSEHQLVGRTKTAILTCFTCLKFCGQLSRCLV